MSKPSEKQTASTFATANEVSVGLDFDTPLSQLLAAVGSLALRCSKGESERAESVVQLAVALETIQKCKYVEMFGLVIEAGGIAGDTDEPDTPASEKKATDKTKAH